MFCVKLGELVLIRVLSAVLLSMSTAAVLSAGVRHPALTMSTDSNNIRNIPVNSDMFLVKGEDNVPTDEKFFYRFVIVSFLSSLQFSLSYYSGV